MPVRRSPQQLAARPPHRSLGSQGRADPCECARKLLAEYIWSVAVNDLKCLLFGSGKTISANLDLGNCPCLAVIEFLLV